MTPQDSSDVKADWCRSEFAEVDFGDRRLHDRFIDTAVRLSKRPSSTVNQACGSWARTKAAYRMLDNDSVTHQEILRVHQKKTLERISHLSQVIVVQDTCFLNYDHHFSTKGLGVIGMHAGASHESRGLIIHHALAVDPVDNGIPLGLIDQKIWARIHKKKSHSTRLIEDKESFKWIDTLRAVAGLVPPEMQVITVSDRESDYFEYLAESLKLQKSFIVRSRYDRRIVKAKPELGSRRVSLLWDFLNKQPVVGTFSLEIPAVSATRRRSSRKKRTASLEIRFGRVTLDPSAVMHHIVGKDRILLGLLPIEVNVVWIKEVRPPKEIEPVDWKLVTNLPIYHVQDAMQVTQFYTLRWHIENLHHVLKSGCHIEDSHLQNATRLRKYISLMSVIAWRIYLISRISRTYPEAACTDFFTNDEWVPLYCTSSYLPALSPTSFSS